MFKALRDAFLQKLEPAADELLPYRRHVTEQVIECQGGILMAMFRVAGLSQELDEDHQVHDRWSTMNERLKALADPRRGLMAHMVKSASSPDDYPGGACRSVFGARFNDAYRAGLWDEARPLRRMDMYLTLMVMPLEQSRQSGRKRMSTKERTVGTNEPMPARVRAIEDFCLQAAAQLGDFRPVRLGLRQDNGIAFSEMAEALHHILFNERLPIPLPRGPLAHAIMSVRPAIGNGTVWLGMPGGSQYAATFGQRVPSSSAWPKAFLKVQNAHYRFCLTHSFFYWPVASAHRKMTLVWNQATNTSDPASDQTDLLKTFARRLMNNEIGAGDNHMSLTVYAEQGPATDVLANVNRVAAEARAHLADAGISATREDKALVAAFYAQMPGNNRFRVRPGLATTENLAADMPLDLPPEGERQGKWGEPVLMLRTRAGTPFRFHLHAPRAIGEEGDLGNTLVIGPAGSGKTVVLGGIITQAERLDAQVIVFDKDRGLEILVRALGGNYSRLRTEAMDVAPLRARQNTAHARTFLTELIKGFVMSDGAPAPTSDEWTALTMAVRTIMRLPPEERDLAELGAFLPRADRNGIGARLQRWMAGGSLGWIADGARDGIDLDADVVGFDMTEVLDHPDARGPIMADLFDRIEERLGKRRVLLIIDEFWKALLDPMFAPLVNDKLKTIRKRDGAVVLATQSIKDVLQSPISHTVLEQCPTKIWMANPSAPESAHVGVGSAGLSPARFEAVKRGAVRDRAFLVEQQETAVMATLPLGHMPWALHVMSARDQTLPLLDQLLSQHGPEPAAWLDRFIAEAPAALRASRRNAA